MRLMPIRAFRTITVEPNLPETLQPLITLSRNLWWTWNKDAAIAFRDIDPALWERCTHNPVRMLQMADTDRFERLGRDEEFVARVRSVWESFHHYMGRPPRSILGAGGVVAYFSMEFALTESLPSYSGGLGVLAGDHLKSASDVRLPLVGVGLFYQEGYFHQQLDESGWQRESYSTIDPVGQPFAQVEDASGHPISVRVPFPGREVIAAVLRLDVGQVPLYLLDTNVDENSPEDREITCRLYGGDDEMRVKQEMVLGIGGARALEAVGIQPSVYHMNEGHSAFLGLERIRRLMEEQGLSFDEARIPVSASTVFTTHTAVAAGIDKFSPDLLSAQLGPYYRAIGLDDHAFRGLGRTNPDNELEPFSMAVLGLHLSGKRNGVSQLHGDVSRRLWSNAWAGEPEELTPIGAVTNGVHLPTWVANELSHLYDRAVGADWRDAPQDASPWQNLCDIPNAELWETHVMLRERLVARAQVRFITDAARAGRIVNGPRPLRPDALTIGFARRFAAYKRATLLFHDPERLARILNNPDRPVQIIFAGKSHPRDEGGKQLIREVSEFSRRPEFRDHLVILEDYDVDLARTLVQGCDVWLNTPLRPMEASGTSGMKAVANGCLHLSVRDGWWAEAYREPFGWAIGNGSVGSDPASQDELDAHALYDLLEQEVVPLFYSRDASGMPDAWVDRMRGSICEYAPRFNSGRMVNDYADGSYVPAAEAGRRLSQDEFRVTRNAAAWLARIRSAWSGVKILSIEDEPGRQAQTGKPVKVSVQVHTGQLAPTDVRVDLVFGEANLAQQSAATGISSLMFSGATSEGVHQFVGDFRPAHGGRIGYAIRVLPFHADLDTLDTGLVLWS